MTLSETIAERTIKRNVKIYKIIRKFYDKIKFEKSASKNKKYFEERIKKIKPFAEKFLDFSSKPDKNVILITIDCLRNDHLSYNGYHRETTPFLDTLRGYRASLISTSPWTYPAIASLLTGFYPHNHGAILDEQYRKFDISKLKPLRSNILTLGEILALFGYATYFNSGVDLAMLSVRRRFGEQKLSSLTDGDVILKNLKEWITKQKSPFFAYAHLKDPHEPLIPPKDFYNYFGMVKKLTKIEYWGNFQRPEKQKGKKFEEFKENKLLLYDNTLRYVDHIIKQFYKFLEDKGLTDTTILIITTDHGEEFWDHSELEAKHFYDVRGYAGIGHGHNVFNELIQVPLIITGPDVPRKVENKFISGVDIVPTLLDLLKIQNNILFDGMNMFKAPKKRIILSENTIHGYEKKALIYGKLKFIYSEKDRVAWIFNFKNDPEEKDPIEDKELSEIFTEKLSKAISEKLMFWRVLT
jgi:arylsulfatase A-like enzyme